MSRLSVDCLNEIFEYLEKDKITLHSCLLVNRLWCEVSVRILWRNVQNHATLITCLPNETKEILYKNQIIIPDPTSKPPLFNYIQFIKILSIHDIDDIIKNILKNYQSITPQSLSYKKHIIAQEIYKSFMNQISLKELHFNSFKLIQIPNFTSYPGARDCLKNLSELSFHSDISPEFFYQLSQLCHNIKYLYITFNKVISNGITDLISVQQNLTYLHITQSYDCGDLADIIPSLLNLSNTLIKLYIYGGLNFIPLSFIAKFTNLQELVLDLYHNFTKFDALQYVTFPQLQILKFISGSPRYGLLINFLENNGSNLKELHTHKYHNPDISLNLAIAKFCPNLRKLYIGFQNIEFEKIKIFFNSCKYLESLKIWSDGYLNEKEILEVLLNYSPRNFCEFKIYNDIYTHDPESEQPEELSLDYLEYFFISWKNRMHKPLSFIIIKDEFVTDVDEEKMMIIEKYKKLGNIKIFETVNYDENWMGN